MNIYILIAYHKTKTQRESLGTSSNLNLLKATAVNTDPVKFKEYDLVIEDDGEDVVKFVIRDNQFTELSET